MMKFIIASLIAFFTFTGAMAQGVLELTKSQLELKNLQADDEPMTLVFSFKNTGDKPLLLTRVMPMTGLLHVDWSRGPIVPGKSGEIRVRFIPMQMPEKFQYRISLHSNAKNSRGEITLSGNIVDNPNKPELLYNFNLDGLKFKTTSIDFNDVYTWQTVSDTLYYINSRKEPVTLSVKSQPDYIRTTFLPETIAAGKKGCIIVSFNASEKHDYGYSYDNVILSLNHNLDYKNRIVTTARLIEDFSKLSKEELQNAPVVSFDKTQMSFGEIKQGEEATCDFVLKNTGKSTLFIRKIHASCGCTAVTPGSRAIAPGKSTTLRIVFDSKGKMGKQVKSIVITTNDPKHPESTISVNGTIKEN